MLNFISSLQCKRTGTRNTCTPDMDVIQGCIGCDGGCSGFCDAACENICQNNSATSSGGTGCFHECSGSCLSLASIIGFK